MTHSVLLGFAIFAPMIAGLLTLVLPRQALGLRVLVAVAGPVVALGLLCWHIAVAGFDHPAQYAQWMPALKLNFDLNADRLGLFFALLVSGIGLLITLYARAYFGPDRDSLYRFYPSLHLFMTAMVGLVLADNFMLLLLFWEMTSISSFLLIGWERDNAVAVKNALQAFVVTGAGGLVLMGGLILMGVVTGAWSFTALGAVDLFAMGRDPLLIAAFVMIFFGAAAKSAQWPLHFWLPGAMAAPTPVSAYLHSATMVKAGVYLVGRCWPFFAMALPLWPLMIAPIGGITMLLGAYIALRKSDLKQIFAYTTVSQLGLLMCMYGLSSYTYRGEPNLVWDITQILNHALYKAPLFLLAGAIAHVAHTRELPELRGFFHHGHGSRVMTVLLIAAAYSMAAAPFTLSFTAKEFFFYGIYHAWEATRSPWLAALATAGILTGAINVAIFIRLTRVLLGAPHVRPPAPPGAGDEGPAQDYQAPLTAHAHSSNHHEAHDDGHEAGFWPSMLWVPALLIVAWQFVGGILPGAFERLIRPIEASPFYFDYLPGFFYAVTHPSPPLYMSVAGYAIGIGLGFAPVFTRAIRDVHDAIFPGFYDLTTKGGGWLFGLVQTGNVRTYIAVISLAMVGLIAWSMGLRPTNAAPDHLSWPDGAHLEPFADLMPGYLITFLVCVSAILMPLVKERAGRVLVLGTVGFCVAAVFYLYHAPDLALTQISIEIVSLVLFLLVLSLIPRTVEARQRAVLPRLVIAASVGVVMFWITLVSSVGPRPVKPYGNRDGRPFTALGEFFLRNSDKGVDVEGLHIGGGGGNVVNVILVDFRGFDTLGEIIVLALAALGVWTLLRRRTRGKGRWSVRRAFSEKPHVTTTALAPRYGNMLTGGSQR
jgi:NADH:ubiquinone oxidoreductase subunit 5 (subunit L)/multisubunit Na+/H+ antiporter MnhA subunit/multisubunit Na+/H+ antiporter MnhB subunit